MDKTHSSSSSAEQEDPNSTTQHDLESSLDLTPEEFIELKPSVLEHHTYSMTTRQCSSLLAQRIHAPPHAVWSVVRCFDNPQAYKHFIKSCHVKEGFQLAVGSTRDVNIISGLPAATSTERLDLLDDDRYVIGFTIVGGDHRLRNYRSVTSVHGFERDGKIWTLVLESYVVDVPEGNSEEDTRLFADTVVKLNLQKLASVTEGMCGDGDVKVKLQNNILHVQICDPFECSKQCHCFSFMWRWNTVQAAGHGQNKFSKVISNTSC